MLSTRIVSALSRKQFLSFALILSCFIAYGSSATQAVAANRPPRISNVGAVLYGGIAYVTGSVSDPDNNPTGWTVYIDGSVSGTATVGADGRFWFRASILLPLRRRGSIDAGSPWRLVEYGLF